MAVMTTVPGMKAKHAIITPECRAGRGEDGAFDEAVHRLKLEYNECVAVDANLNVSYHLILTVGRPEEECSHCPCKSTYKGACCFCERLT